MKILRGKQWALRNGKMVEIPKHSTIYVDAPAVHDDEMDPIQHHCDSKYYTSKSEFRKTTRAHGCIEVGNEPLENMKRPPKLDEGCVEQDIAEAYKIFESSGDVRDQLMHEIDATSPGWNPFGEE